jgi:hypothetical protein
MAQHFAKSATVTTTCPQCNAEHHWNWEEAFEKFGFDDGDGLVMTGSVVAVLRAAGYTVKTTTWGMHNTLITSIKKDRREQIPPWINVGYDNPRDYLPAEIVAVLDGGDYG